MPTKGAERAAEKLVDLYMSWSNRYPKTAKVIRKNMSVEIEEESGLAELARAAEELLGEFDVFEPDDSHWRECQWCHTPYPDADEDRQCDTDWCRGRALRAALKKVVG